MGEVNIGEPSLLSVEEIAPVEAGPWREDPKVLDHLRGCLVEEDSLFLEAPGLGELSALEPGTPSAAGVPSESGTLLRMEDLVGACGALS